MKKTLLIIGLTICLRQVYAQSSPARLSLETLLQHVETNYPAIEQYQQNIQSWLAKAQAAKALMPPTFSAGIMRFPYQTAMIKEKDNAMNQAGIAFSAEQMIVNPKKLDARRDYLHSLTAVETSKGEWTKNELRKQAKLLYYGRFVSEQKQRIVIESQQVLNLLIATAQAKFSNNQSQLPTIYKANAKLAELKNMQSMLLAVIAEANIGINTFMVRQVNTVFAIDTLISANFAKIEIVVNRQ